ncbi:helix-turn-helix domain-containing protein [Streptoalloteichus hindustanus]|uniref:Helix-turn-helix domain-containing protein n=1 Tax=Streptoalloteichus hindustanus TaxID=2017 RepID=A0A1M5MHI3_STRHI|nr:helix-turn-helix transcriptional regulator [Streptoalloteichus hindustanus]SHG76572.1 Helix-turn-helix domain-containing protein [Streptoalloteichus hindustanus]
MEGDVRAELSQFLKSRRARLRPEVVGLPDHGHRRRVPGLRREELAQLAGVSLTHYVRLEQGHGRNVSPEVLDAVAGALRLTRDERAYLHSLVRPVCRRGDRAGAPVVRPQLLDLVDSMELTPVFVLGHHTELLAWNPLAVRVFGDFAAMPPGQRTLSHWLFFAESTRSLLGKAWAELARVNVGMLRAASARRCHDERLRGHVSVMRTRSAEFERMWQDHDVLECSHGGESVFVLNHPEVGELTLNYQNLSLPVDLELGGMHAWTASSGSASRAKLRGLALSASSSSVD